MRKLVTAAALMVAAQGALAQSFSIEFSNGMNTSNGNAGSSITFNVEFTANAMMDVNGFQATVAPDGAFFDMSSLSGTAGSVGDAQLTCGSDGQILAFNLSGNAYPDGTACTYTVNLLGTVNPGDSGNIALTGMEFSNGATTVASPPDNATAGTVTVAVGSALTGPTPATAMITAPRGGTSPTQNFAIGADGAVTGITCTDDSGADAATFDFSGATDLTASTTFNVVGSCNTAAAVASQDGSFTCTGTGDQSNSTSVSGTLNCTVSTTPPVPGSSVGGTLNLGIGGPGTNLSGTFSIRDTNPATDGSAIGYACTADAGITITGGSGTFSAPAASAPIGVTAGAGVIGSVTCTTTVGGNAGPTVTVNVVSTIQAVNVPTLSEWAMILMAMALAGFGVSRLRRNDV